MTWLGKLAAQRRALSVLLRAVRAAARTGMSLWEYRQALSKTAQAGDFDALYEVYVTPGQLRARRYLETGDLEKRSDSR